MEKNKFIRLCTDEFFKSRVERFINKLSSGNPESLNTWYPSETNPDYEKYPYKKFKGKYVEEYTECPAGVFAYRYLKLWRNEIKKHPWIRFSYINDENKRSCKTMYVINIEWENGPYSQYIKFSGFNQDAEYSSLTLKVYELAELCVSIVSDEQVELLNSMLNSCFPEPYIPIFKIYKDYYSEHYDEYLEDCKQHGITPFSIEMINMASRDIFIDVKSGCMASEYADTYIVNKKNI